MALQHLSFVTNAIIINVEHIGSTLNSRHRYVLAEVKVKYVLAVLALKYITAAAVHAAKIVNFVDNDISPTSGALDLDMLGICHDAIPLFRRGSHAADQGDELTA